MSEGDGVCGNDTQKSRMFTAMITVKQRLLSILVYVKYIMRGEQYVAG